MLLWAPADAGLGPYVGDWWICLKSYVICRGNGRSVGCGINVNRVSQLHYKFVVCLGEFIAQAAERITFPSASKTVALALSEAWDEFFWQFGFDGSGSVNQRENPLSGASY